MKKVVLGVVVACLSAGRAGDFVWESERDVPVVTNVDVVVVGGTSAGVAAAVAARQSGASVYLASAMPYLGEDLAGTLELGATPADRADPLVRRLWTQTGGCAAYTYRVEVDKDGPWVYRSDVGYKLSESADPRTTRDSLRHTGDTSVLCTLAEPSGIVAVEAIAFDRPDIVPPADQSQDARQEADRERAERDSRAYGRTSRITAEVLAGDNKGARIDLAPVDTLWVEGDYKSGKAHAVVFRGAVTGVVSKVRLDFFKDPEVTCQFISRIRFRRPAETVREVLPAPLKVKRDLDAELLSADVDFLTASPVCGILRDDAGRAAGVVMANRSGRQAVRAKAVIDATVWGAAGGDLSALTAVSRVIKAKTRPEVGDARVTSVDETNGLWRIEKDVACAKPDWRTLAAAKVASDDWSWQDGLADQSAWPVFRFAARTEASVPGVWRVFPDGALGGRLAKARAAGRAAAEATREAALPVPCASGQGARPAEAGDTRELAGGLRAWERRHDETVRLGAVRLPVLAETDTVVVGLGTAGTAAAIGAARGGARTIGLECSPVPGGIGTEGLICGYYDGNQVGFQREFERLITELKGRTRIMKYRRVLVWRRLLAEAGVESWYGCFASGVYLREPGVVGGVVVVTPLGRGVVLAKNVIDATGNSEIAAAAGAGTVFGGQGEFALQSAGLAPYRAGSGGVNSDFGYVNDTDARDAWLFMVKGRAGARDAWDVSSILDSRERRRILSDYVLEGWDVTAGRRFSDTVVQARSRQDSHGYLVDDYWYVQPKHDPRVPRDVNVPLRSLLPRGLSNLAVIGLGSGVARDVMPFVRMQADLMNMGYAVGLLSAGGVDFRRADLRGVQYRLVEEGVLRREVLGWTEDPEPDDAALAAAVANLKDGFADSGIVWRCRERARPLVEEAYRTASTDSARLAYATVLGLWGSPLGTDDLIAAYARHPQNLGVAVALGRGRGPGASAALVAQLKKLSGKEDLRLVRAVCRGLEESRDPAAAPYLAEALRRPGVAGHDLRQVKDVPAMGGYGLSPVVDRSLVELSYARALLACGDSEGLGLATYRRYAQDVRGFLAEHAHRVLTNAR